MSDSPPEAGAGPEPTLGSMPGDRRPGGSARLAVPPSVRYAKAAPEEAEDEASLARGVVVGLVVAGFGAAILVVLGGAFTFTAGLIVVAAFLGRFTAIGVRIGAGRAVSGNRRAALAVVLALLGVVAAQLGLWAWSVALEPGALGPLDFLAQTYGMLVPLELLLAGGVAWLTAD